MKQLLRVGGLVPLSTVDYPGALAAVIFCQGCSWRCRYCHNPELLHSTGNTELNWNEIIDFLKRRQGLLDAVVFSGGEPTLQKALEMAIREVQCLGYKIGLHTAGSAPERLSAILPLINWVGLDIKAPKYLHQTITGVPGSGACAWDSVRRIINSGVAYEIRITLHTDLITLQDLNEMLSELKALGVNNIVVQKCRTNLVLDPKLQFTFPNIQIYQPVLDAAGIAVL